MSYSREVYEQVLQLYADRRAKAVDTLTAHKKEIYQKIPQISEIDRRLRQTSVRLSMTLFDEKLADVSAAIDVYKRQAEKFQFALMEQNRSPMQTADDHVALPQQLIERLVAYPLVFHIAFSAAAVIAYIRAEKLQRRAGAMTDDTHAENSGLEPGDLPRPAAEIGVTIAV